MIDSDNKKTKTFEDYINNMFNKDNLLIQFVWKFEKLKDFNSALEIMDDINNNNRNEALEKMKDYGEFFAYFYKNDKSNRDAKIIDYGEDIDYPKTIDTSQINVNLFDFNVEIKSQNILIG